MVGSRDIKVGNIHGCDFYMSPEQFEYMQHSHITIDVVAGRGSSFSIEIPLGVRFISISRLFTDDEYKNLDPLDME